MGVYSDVRQQYATEPVSGSKGHTLLLAHVESTPHQPTGRRTAGTQEALCAMPHTHSPTPA